MSAYINKSKHNELYCLTLRSISADRRTSTRLTRRPAASNHPRLRPYANPRTHLYFLSPQCVPSPGSRSGPTVALQRILTTRHRQAALNRWLGSHGPPSPGRCHRGLLLVSRSLREIETRLWLAARFHSRPRLRADWLLISAVKKGRKLIGGGSIVVVCVWIESHVTSIEAKNNEYYFDDRGVCMDAGKVALGRAPFLSFCFYFNPKRVMHLMDRARGLDLISLKWWSCFGGIIRNSQTHFLTLSNVWVCKNGCSATVREGFTCGSNVSEGVKRPH